MVLGPFPNDRENKGFAAVYAPEKEIDFAKRYESHIFGAGAKFEVKDATCGDERKRCLSLRPPWQRRVRTGTVIASFPLTLPERDGLKLTLFTGLEKGSASDGVQFLVRIGQEVLLKRLVKKPAPWEPAEVDLAPYAGKTVALEIAVDGHRRSRKDYGVVGEPRIVAGDDVLVDLIALAPKAKPRIAIPGQTDQLAWTAVPITDLDARLELHDLLPPPIQYQTAYAVADITLAAEATVRFWIEHDDGFKLWLNGEKAAERNSHGADHFDAKLPAGRTRLLVKICNLAEWWRLRLRLTDPKGHRIPGLRHGE